jgi:hypothetical protein
MRRLVLTAVVSVCAPGTSSQAVFSLLISLFYIKVYGYYAPYTDRQDSVLAETGQFQVFLTFFIALIIQNSLLPGFWASPLGIILIVVNLSVLYYTLYIELKNVLQNEEASSETHFTKKSGITQNSVSDPKSFNYGSDDANASSTDWGDVEMHGQGRASFIYGPDSDDDSSDEDSDDE